MGSENESSDTPCVQLVYPTLCNLTFWQCPLQMRNQDKYKKNLSVEVIKMMSEFKKAKDGWMLTCALTSPHVLI